MNFNHSLALWRLSSLYDYWAWVLFLRGMDNHQKRACWNLPACTVILFVLLSKSHIPTEYLGNCTHGLI